MAFFQTGFVSSRWSLTYKNKHLSRILSRAGTLLLSICHSPSSFWTVTCTKASTLDAPGHGYFAQDCRMPTPWQYLWQHVNPGAGFQVAIIRSVINNDSLDLTHKIDILRFPKLRVPGDVLPIAAFITCVYLGGIVEGAIKVKIRAYPNLPWYRSKWGGVFW